MTIVVILSGCKKLVEIDPPKDQITSGDIYSTDKNAITVLAGMYADMSYYSVFSGKEGLTVEVGVSADDFGSVANESDVLHDFFSNSLTRSDDFIWERLYAFVFRANAAIEGLNSSKKLTRSVREQLTGEAKFLRAFYYFYLTNLYGDVPLLTTTDPAVTSVAPRAPQASVYKQIINDLQESEALMSQGYLSGDAKTPSADRFRPCGFVASALLTRVYLYNKQWQLAEAEASKLIDNVGTFELSPTNSVFLTESKETIWQLQPTVFGRNTLEAPVFVLYPSTDGSTPAGPSSDARPFYINNQLYNSFENGDERKKVWIDSVQVGGIVYPFSTKYKAWEAGAPSTESQIVFRLAEQYLIRAEARAQQGKLTGSNSAQSDIDIIRNRAGLINTTESSQSGLLDAILKERRVELFAEWGHRWLDLKRTNKINEVMQPAALLKGGQWQPYKALFPIPVQDIQRNPSLKGHQNPGYPES
jgi:hypothetical protein